MTSNSLKKAVEKFYAENSDYYKQWIYNDPIIISNQHHKKLAKLQKVMHKLIIEFVTNFEEYQNLMFLSENTKRIVNALKDIPYEVGTYRTDFVYDEFKQPKLIEITCRFALNGIFFSSILNTYGNSYHKDKLSELSVVDVFQNIYDYIAKLSGTGAVYLLKGRDPKNESSLFKSIFNYAGNKVIEIHYKDISASLKDMENSWIISELTIDEIESLDINIVKSLSKLNIVNDFRTVLLIHDKQFFSALGNQELQMSCLTNEEIDFFKDYYIPTYHRNEFEELWKDAKLNKDRWILKHKALGKSKSVYAGIVTAQEDWDAVLLSEEIENFILQEWVPQKKITGQILDQKYEDYITGTLLFFNDNYFGVGLFRTSSHPVTNVVDDRKSASLVLENNKADFDKIFYNYID